MLPPPPGCLLATTCQIQPEGKKALAFWKQVLEETGIELDDVHFAYAVNSVFESGAHYVTIFMRAEVGEVSHTYLHMQLSLGPGGSHVGTHIAMARL